MAWLSVRDLFRFFSGFVLALTTIIAGLGSVPFILREQLSYSQLATFALSSYPYSLKLFWSPIVDAVYFPSVGRRKSWIIPMQAIIGSMMLWMSFTVQEIMDNVCASSFLRPFVSARADCSENAGNRTCIQTNVRFHVTGPYCCYARQVANSACGYAV